MKKLTRKLLLSVFSLGLAVVTLSTTTFAWYTANASVSATGVTSTTQADVSGSLEISETGADGTWGPTVDLAMDVTDLVPLQHTTASDLKAMDGTSTGKYLQFTFYIRTSTNLGTPTNVYLQSFEITNTTETLPSKNQLVESGVAGMPGDLGDPYTVDVVRALSLAISEGVNVIGTQEYSYGEAYTTPKADTVKDNATMDALAYYNAVMTTNAPTDKSSTEKNLSVVAGGFDAIEVAVIPSDAVSQTPSTAVAVTVTVWLDGWDKYCFDACQAQSFSIKFSLTTEENQTKIGTVKATS